VHLIPRHVPFIPQLTAGEADRGYSRTMQSYKIEIPRADVEDLAQRLKHARFPYVARGDREWSRGVPREYLSELANYWQHRFDWRQQEAALNQHAQVSMTIDDQPIHCFHIKSRNKNAMPLLLAHGWPSSSVEFLKLVGPLTDPAAHGGDPDDAFHLVLPTTPGFGLSSPVGDDWDAMRTARAYRELMTRLGYERYGAHGGDIGADILGELNKIDPRLVGLHTSTDMGSIIWYAKFTGADPATNPALSDEEKRDVRALIDRGASDGGYLEIQKTRPLTIGYLLVDSPLGQLAWIVEKMQGWTDSRKALPEDAVDIDQMLTNISLYWFTKSGASAATFIHNNLRAQRDWGAPSHAPVGMACFGATSAARRLIDPEGELTHWSEFDAGGHFPAMEVPALLAGDLRQFFRTRR
jgi:pimeloyl-ACP methyl ester carboxylesterase